MITQIDHIGIAVKELESQVKLYRDLLGLDFHGYEDLPDRGLRVAVFEVKGVRVELIKSIDPESAIGRFIEKKGEGLHHIAFRSDQAAGLLKKLDEAGIRLIDKEPKPGAGGMKVAFLHPGSTHKVLMEICEKSK